MNTCINNYCFFSKSLFLLKIKHNIFRCLLHVSHSEVMDFWLQVRFPCTEIWWENAVTWKTRLHVSAANYLKDKYFSRFSRFSFSGTNGAVFKIAILCMVCNKLFCSVRVYYSGRCFKRKRVWPLLNVLQCLKKISYSLQKFQDCNHNVIHVTEAWCLQGNNNFWCLNSPGSFLI